MQPPFPYLENASPEKLIMTARQHMAIAGLYPSETSKVLASSGWSCNRCGVCLPFFMEFDGGHDGKAPTGAICQFCHNIDHVIWAAARGRITPILLPEGSTPISQQDISYLSWMILSTVDESDKIIPLGEGEQDVGLAEISSILLDLRQSLISAHEVFLMKFGDSTTAESFLEGVYTSMRVGVDISPTLRDVGSRVYMIPSPVIFPASSLRVSARVSVWNGTSFSDITDGVRPAFMSGLSTALLRVDALVKSLKKFNPKGKSDMDEAVAV